jgi:hypothetical protein
MPYPGLTTEEVARRGQELYERKPRHKVEPEQIGRFLVVDIESGDYEVADVDLSASDRMLARRLDGVRVGRDYAYGLGTLAGISLIWGHRVNLNTTENGEVVIEPL